MQSNGPLPQVDAKNTCKQIPAVSLNSCLDMTAPSKSHAHTLNLPHTYYFFQTNRTGSPPSTCHSCRNSHPQTMTCFHHRHYFNPGLWLHLVVKKSGSFRTLLMNGQEDGGNSTWYVGPVGVMKKTGGYQIEKLPTPKLWISGSLTGRGPKFFSGGESVMVVPPLCCIRTLMTTLGSVFDYVS